MSKTIDQRVVEMQFDNKQFESNVKTSMHTLEGLKKSLDLSSSAKSLDNLKAASNSFTLDGIGTAVESIQDKFSAFGIFSIEIFRRISNAAIDCGTKMVSALTIDPAKAGFQEYELKMGSVQTIMAGTGESLETVNKYLQELNEYSDKTIYSFSDMTSNIGKFTNAGVKLEDAVLAIKGISNEAAVSGANAQEASRAMYNFSQALSAGYVKLIDWKSIENANMATMEFKNQLIETALAVGTIEKVGDKFRTTTTDAKGDVSDLFDATKNFNDALSHQWMTTDVLVQTLGKYADESTEIGKKAFASAQDIKTFTMMMDTLKEAAQSGWAVSMEYIIGDFEEAKQLWTEIGTKLGDMIADSAEERNKLIGGWADGGGREAVIAGFGNAWKTVLEIIKPVREYFRDIFPQVEVKKLIEISKNFEKFTKSLLENKTLITNLQNTFKGFFAVIGIAKQAFTAFFNTIKPVFGIFDGLASTIFESTGSIGKWLVNLNTTLEETAFFENFFGNIATKISEVFTNVKKTISDVIMWFKNFGSAAKENIQIPGTEVILTFVDTLHRRLREASGSVEGFKNVVNNAFAAIGQWFEESGLMTVFGGLLMVLKAVWDGAVMIGAGIASAFKYICNEISTALADADFEAGFDILNSGLFAAILIGVNRFVNGLKTPLKEISSFTEGITDILGGVKDSLETWQNSLKAGTLLKIAGAIGILAAALLVISTIDSNKLSSSLAAISAMMVELMVSLTAFSAIANRTKGGMTKLTATMIGISVSVLILAGAMKALSDLEWEDIGQGVAGIAGMAAVLVLAVQQLNKCQGRMLKGATGLVIFAAALRVLVGAVQSLGEMDTLKLIKGLAGVGILMSELALFIQVAKFGKLSVTTAAGILILAAAVKEFSESVAIFGEMDTSQLIQGMQAMGVLLAELAIFIKITSGSKGMVTAAAGMVILAASMGMFASAVGRLGVLPIEQLIAGLTGMSAVLTMISIAMNLLPKNMVSLGVGMVAVAGSLIMLANAVTTMGGLKPTELAVGLIGLAVALGVITTAVNLMKTAMSGAATLLIVASAFSLLTPSLILLSKLSWEEIGKGLAMLGGSLAILLAAGALAGVIAPGLLALGGALALIGVGVAGVGVGLLAAGTGLAALGAGFATLAVLGTAGATAVVAALGVIIVGIADMIPAIAKKIGEAFVVFAEVISASAPILVTTILTVLESLITALVNAIPMAMNGIYTLLVSIMDVLVEFTPKLMEGGLNIVLAILTGIANNIMRITELAIDIVIQFLQGIASKLPEVIQAGFDLLVSFLNGMADAINNNTDIVIDAFNNLIMALVNAGISVLDNSIELFLNIGKKIMDSGLVRGIRDKFKDVQNACKEAVNKGIAGVKSKFEDFRAAGREIINGFVKGIKDKFQDAINAGKELGKKILDAAKEKLGIASPSKEFIEIGRWSVLGLAKGLHKYASVVSESAKDVGQNAMDAMSMTLSNIADAINGDMDLTPVITPVLDLSNVKTGSKELTGMLNTGTISLSTARVQAANISRQMSGVVADMGSGSKSVANNTNFSFVQNNYSPTALSRAEIYRQTNNQFSALKGLVATR